MLISLMNERYFGAMREQNDEEVHVPEPLPWYPFAYQMNMSRTAVRSQPVLKNFHNFLVTEAELVRLLFLPSQSFIRFIVVRHSDEFSPLIGLAH